MSLGNNESANARDARSNVSVPAEKLNRAERSRFGGDDVVMGMIVEIGVSQKRGQCVLRLQTSSVGLLD